MNQKLSEDVAYLGTQYSPLNSTQLSIFLDDHASDSEDLYNIAHCVELPSQMHIEHFKQAIQYGLHEADSVTAHYSPQAGVNWSAYQKDINIECFDFRHLTQVQAIKRVWQWMPSDRTVAKSLKNPHVNLSRQVLFITHQQIFWYQRYHHIMLDCFSFTRLTQRIFKIYQQLQQQNPILECPFSPSTEVLTERQQYRQSDAYQCDQHFWTAYCQNLANPISLSQNPATPRRTSQVIQHQLEFSCGILSDIQQVAATYKLSLADVLMSLALFYMHQKTQAPRLVMNVPFMRRLGSKALRATLPTVNTLPVQFHIKNNPTWINLAKHVQQQIQQVRQHQQYDAAELYNQLKKLNIQDRLFTASLNYKAFNQDVHLDGQAVLTHHISTGPIYDFEFSFMLQHGKLVIDLRADVERYTQQEIVAHGQQLSTLLEQCLNATMHVDKQNQFHTAHNIHKGATPAFEITL